MIGAALVAAAALTPADMAPPAPPPASQVYDVAGVTVIHDATPGEVVALRLYLLGGARQVGPGDAGVEPLLLRAAAWGTAGFPGPASRAAEVATGGSIFVREDVDWTVIGVDVLPEDAGPAWTVLADRVARPAFDPAGVEVERGKMLAAVRSRDDSPDAIVGRLAESLAFEGHAYGVPVEGTVASLSGLGVEELRRYHAEEVVRSRMMLVVVGDVSRSEVEGWIEDGLGALPLGSYEWTPPEPWAHDEPRLRAEPRSLPTNYVYGLYAGPLAGSDDWAAFQVGVSVLSSLVHAVLREEGLTYTAGAPFYDRAASGAGVYVSTRDPERAVRIIGDAIDLLSRGAIRRRLLQDAADDSVLEFWLETETAGSRADFLARTWLLEGTVLDAERYVERLKDVTSYQVRAAFDRYVKNIQYAYLGPLGTAPERQMRRHE